MASSSSLIFVPLSLILHLTFFKLSLASVAMQSATVHPGRPTACFNSDKNSYREDGESWQIAGCGMATCVGIPQPSGKSKMMISFEGCGTVGHEPGCHVIEDKQAEYPDCCPEVICSSVENEADVDDFTFHKSNSIAATDTSTTLKVVGHNETTPSLFAPQDISNKAPSTVSSWEDEDDFQSLDEKRAPSRNNYAIFSSEEEPSFAKSNYYGDRQKDLFRLKFSPIPFYWV